MKPDFNGVSYDRLTTLRSELMERAGQAFNALVEGRNDISHTIYVDPDPFHDRPPRRLIKLDVNLIVLQEVK